MAELLVVLLLVCVVLAWAPVVADLADEFRNDPPPHSRRRQRQARRTACALRSLPNRAIAPERAPMRGHSSTPVPPR